ncbi:hypothetical protein [Myceligenerans indicum]|uniref:DUF3592 domain-containing protein n=1 Tax=Myceligenerans indicum TaxID=2593663 RepID=A0ABS1LNH4_9MICO|nr:hypothetical protein [Myceligenerans indicum]MBL0887738.1 hypothetical protein [Myceligenerans indicum]
MTRSRGPFGLLVAVIRRQAAQTSRASLGHLVKNLIAAAVLLPWITTLVVHAAITQYALDTRGVVADAVVAETQPEPAARGNVAIDIEPFGDGDIRILRHYAQRPASWDGYTFSVTYDPLDPDRVTQTGVDVWPPVLGPMGIAAALVLLWMLPFEVLELLGRASGLRIRQEAREPPR